MILNYPLIGLLHILNCSIITSARRLKLGSNGFPPRSQSPWAYTWNYRDELFVQLRGIVC